MAKAAPIDGLGPKSPIGLAARRALAVRLAEVRALAGPVGLRLAGGAPRPPDEEAVEAVHDLRVATRRLRAALRLFGASLDEARAEVKRLGDLLGPVRDHDVRIAWLAQALERASQADRPGIERLLAEARGGLGPAEAALAQGLARFVDEVAPRLERAFGRAGGRGRLGGEKMRRRLRKRLARLQRRQEAALASSDPRTTHRLRIAAKKLRYQAELLAPAASGVPPLVELLPPLQELLGELHDRDVRLPLLERALVRAHPAEQPGLIALLRDELAERDRLAAELRVELERWRADRLAKSLRAALK